VTKAIETVGGAAYFRKTGLEKLLRDVHAGQFHVMQERQQQEFTGRVAMGLGPAPELNWMAAPAEAAE
jgi:acyl-CoA dehydrogenase